MSARQTRRRPKAGPAKRATSRGKAASSLKGQQGFPRGSKHPSAQLTAELVKALRSGKYDNRPFAELARKWGVSPAAISLARTGKTWTWLPGAKKPLKPTDPRRYRPESRRVNSKSARGRKR
jgi:hypothetical protein